MLYQFIEKHIKVIRPDTIFTHFESDLNVDHQITSKAVITACRPIKKQSVKSFVTKKGFTDISKPEIITFSEMVGLNLIEFDEQTLHHGILLHLIKE